MLREMVRDWRTGALRSHGGVFCDSNRHKILIIFCAPSLTRRQHQWVQIAPLGPHIRLKLEAPTAAIFPTSHPVAPNALAIVSAQQKDPGELNRVFIRKNIVIDGAWTSL